MATYRINLVREDDPTHTVIDVVTVTVPVGNAGAAVVEALKDQPEGITFFGVEQIS